MDPVVDPNNLMRLLRQVRPDHHAVSTRPFHIKRWSAREDPDRPRLPYMPGFTVQIESHAAPPPFGNENDYGAWPRRDLSDVDLDTVTQSALVVSHPPLETEMTTQRETAQLNVTSYIRIGSGSGAQVVVCTVEQPGKPLFQAVAKIFDAMYYRFADDPAPYPRDVTARADMDYAAEAAAYDLLASIGETGASAPTYYGSWTFKLPITSKGVSQLRPVRLVLIEHLEGSDLPSLRVQNSYSSCYDPDAFHLPEDYRLGVLAKAMDIHVRMIHRGLYHGDLAGCNIILTPSPINTPLTIDVNSGATAIPRVVLVDYNIATVYSYTIAGTRPWQALARPMNPMQCFWTWSAADDFEGWVPREWHNSQRLIQEWLVRRFGGKEQRALYEPLAKELEFSNY